MPKTPVPKPTFADHVRLWRLAAPWIVGFWGIAIAMVKAGWIDLPARAADVSTLQSKISKLYDTQRLQNEAINQLKNRSAASDAAQKAINKKLGRIEEQGDIVLKHLLDKSRQ